MSSWETAVKSKRAELQSKIDDLGYPKVEVEGKKKKNVMSLAKNVLSKDELEVTESDVDTLLGKLNAGEWTSEKVTVWRSIFAFSSRSPLADTRALSPSAPSSTEQSLPTNSPIASPTFSLKMQSPVRNISTLNSRRMANRRELFTVYPSVSSVKSMSREKRSIWVTSVGSEGKRKRIQFSSISYSSKVLSSTASQTFLKYVQSLVHVDTTD